MPIINFTFDKEKIPAGAVNVQPAKTGDNSYWTWEEFNGLCLFDREINGYDDSDFYMVVWDAEKKEPFRVTYASTRGWTYPAMASRVDATEEVKAEYRAWAERQRVLRDEEEARAAEARRQAELLEPKPGREVEIVKGRKVPVGTRGRCFWRGFGQYGERIGLTTASGETFWTAVTNARAVGAEG